MSNQLARLLASVLFVLVPFSTAQAVIFDIVVDGTDSVFLAGYTGPVPTAGLAVHGRHGFVTPEALFETLPSMVAVVGGDVVRVADPAVGGVNFFLGFGPPYFGPDGGSTTGSSLSSFGGISGYTGPTGPLAAVFLSDADPTGGIPPAGLDFGTIGLDFLTLAPGLGQVFYIGDGETSGGVLQEFTAPVGATRLYFGIPDGFGFVGPPGAYDDNDGDYRIRIGINEIPNIPEPATLALFGLALVTYAWRYGRVGPAKTARAPRG